MFVNVGKAGTASPFPDPAGTGAFPEFLLLVNGRDDNKDGWIDSGWDGVNNNFDFEKANGLPHLIDEISEWVETEKWLN